MSKVIIFDLDDTLYSENQFVLSGFRVLANWLEEEYRIRGFYEEAQRLHFSGVRGKVFNEALSSLKIVHEEMLIQQMIKIYREHKPSIILHEDAKWALEYFKQCKFLGIITDGYFKTQQNKIVSLGLDNMVSSIVYSDEYGREHWKPSPTPYMKMMEMSGFEERDHVYIGDNPSKDFVTARALGWKTIRINRGYGEYDKLSVRKEYEADYIVNEMFQLKNILNIESSF